VSLPTNIEADILTAWLATLTTVAAGLSPVPVVRSWRDQTAHADYPALLCHVTPGVPDEENTALDAPLWTVLVNVAAVTHTEQTPPASGSTQVAADPTGVTCVSFFAAARAAILAGIPAVSGMSVLNARIDDSQDIGEGPVNMRTFRVQLVIQIQEA